MQTVSQSEQNVTNFQNSWGEVLSCDCNIYELIKKHLLLGNLVAEIKLQETFKCWANTVREIILKIFIQFILYLT